MLASIITLVMIAGSASAVSFTDEDGDGVAEPGEVITLEGDFSIIDDNGIEHFIEEWYWDFDSDGNFDAMGQIVTYSFDEEGNYQVTVHELNGGQYVKNLDIEVTNNDEPEHDCKDWDHIKRFIEKHPENKNKLKWILKKLDKLEEKDTDC